MVETGYLVLIAGFLCCSCNAQDTQSYSQYGDHYDSFENRIFWSFEEKLQLIKNRCDQKLENSEKKYQQIIETLQNLVSEFQHMEDNTKQKFQEVNTTLQRIQRDKDTVRAIPKGEPGLPGLHGLPGQKGSSGSKGQHGFPGIEGHRGPAGLKGDPGLKGDKGIPGVPGLHGSKGEKGARGHIGYFGQKGEAGMQGLPGRPGPPGPKGLAGIEGISGSKGSKDQKGETEDRNTKYAFSANMNKNEYLRPEGDDPVIVPFKEVKLNTGGQFNSSTSAFTCPLTGVYYFTYNIYSGYLNSCEPGERCKTFAYIQLDGNYINSVLCINEYKDETKHVCTVTNSAILSCNQHSKVTIGTHDNGTQIYGFHGRTSFSGFLVYPTI